jgi:hypothetical protein
MLTFRSGTAGYWDLSGWGGVGNLGGFKPGCTNNMIPADGVLAVPDYTRTCKCSFPTQWSLGLVHDPAAEVWTYQGYAWSGAPVRRVGLNFGAPGDRLAADGTLWLDWPSVGHASPDLPVECAPSRPAPRDVLPTFPPPVKAEGEPPPPPPPPPAPLPETFRMHSSEIGGEGLRWVAASGLRNVEKLAVDLGKGAERRYTVRLHFCEPERLRPGARVFDVWMQGRRVLAGLDVAAGAGGERRALVKEFKGIVVRERLELVLEPGRGSAGAVLSGLEVALEE